MNKNIVWAVPLMMLASGCVSTASTRLSGTTNLPATAATSVTIYQSRLDVPGDYQEIALLDSEGDAIYSDYGQIYKSMRKKAAAMGANGVLLGGESEPSDATKLAAFIFDGTARRQVRATAILVKSEPVVLAPPKKSR